jgi:trehalose synthase
MRNSSSDYIDWLVQHSMLKQVKKILPKYSGNGEYWQRPYAIPRPHDATSLASVWFTSYPPSIITRPEESVLARMGDETLWRIFAEIGIQGIHTGPMKQAGGIYGQEFTPTIDGYFDRIGIDLDSAFGSFEEYRSMLENAAKNGAIVIDDVIPAHTGKGADFRLAERNYEDYRGLYHMVEIAEEDWYLLPDVAEGRDAVNLTSDTVDLLAERGYIVGRLPRVIFYEPGVKETDWSVTDEVEGVDGIFRRWVYLHYFKEGQPALNWLDPSFAAQRLIIGDVLHTLGTMGASMLRLDANGFLGIERRSNGTVWSEGHPLSVVGNQLIAGSVRKVGGFTFQELNLALDDIAAMSEGGPDLSYDFITRPAYQHALVTGNTEFLRLMLEQMHEFKIDPASLIHALQNHDELTLELVHFWFLHPDERYSFQARDWSGAALRGHIRAVMYDRLTGENAPYNLRFTENGVACTTVSIITAALGIQDLSTLTEEDKAKIRQIHLLLAAYNAFQPGVFALSGWDLVGALPLVASEVETLIGGGDTRWINRGAYDLLDVAPSAEVSSAGIPRARSIYGPISEQMRQPDSFVAQLSKMLHIRRDYHIYKATQIDVPNVTSPGLLVMLHELPDELGKQVTVINFGAEPIDEMVDLEGVGSGRYLDMFTSQIDGDLIDQGVMRIRLDGYEWKSYLIIG